MTHAEDEHTGDAEASMDEDATESHSSADEDATDAQASADEETAATGESGDEDTSDADAPAPGEVEDRGAGETSGMEDIRMVAAAIEESHQIRLSTSVRGDDEDDLLPGAVGGFGSIAGAALVRGPATRELVSPPKQEEGPASRARPLLFGAIVVLAIAVGGLSWMVYKSGKEKERASEIAAAQLLAAERNARRSASLDREEEPGRDEEAKPGNDDEEPSEEEAGTDRDDEAENGTGAAATEDPSRDRRPTGKRPRPEEPTPEAGEDPPKGEEEPQPAEEPEAPPPKKPEEIGADCILNPDLPECRDKAEKQNADDSGKADGGRADLPEKLTKNDVRAGFGPVKGQAKACGAQHGVDPGTKVRVKVSISGETGLVISASALGEHADAPVGKCVAEALSKAKFGQFRKSVMGVTYPVTM